MAVIGAVAAVTADDVGRAVVVERVVVRADGVAVREVHRIDVGGDPSLREVVARAGASVSGSETVADVRVVEGMPDFGLDATWCDGQGGASSPVPTWALRAGPDEIVVGLAADPSGAVRRGGVERVVNLLCRGEAGFDRPVLARADATRPAGWRAAHETLRTHAGAMPAATAVRSAVDGDRSYRQLADDAASIAAALQLAGIGRGDVVGLCLDRSDRLIAAMHGVMTAGAAYLPIDRGHPPERVARIVGDAATSLVLVDRTASAELRSALQPALPLLELPTELTGAEPTTVEVDPDDLAYLVYTSGSTGGPKGVMIPHRALVGIMTALSARPGLARRRGHGGAVDAHVRHVGGGGLPPARRRRRDPPGAERADRRRPVPRRVGR